MADDKGVCPLVTELALTLLLQCVSMHLEPDVCTSKTQEVRPNLEVGQR